MCGETLVDDGSCCAGVARSGDCPFVDVREAEGGVGLGQMTVMQGVLADPACGDSWAEVAGTPADFVWSQGAPVLPEHRMEFSIDLPHAGTYYVWVRMASWSDTQDALNVGFDVADLRRIFPPDDYPYNGTWRWVSEVPGAADRLVFGDLTEGPHTFVVAHGEAGARIDKIVVANDAAASFDRSCGLANECSGSETDERACAITNGTGQETRVCEDGTWGDFGNCMVTECDTNYHIEGNACVENVVPVCETGAVLSSCLCGSQIVTGGFCCDGEPRCGSCETCDDNVLNQGESDTDCGGDTSGCVRCALGKTCTKDEDCSSGSCEGTCQHYSMAATLLHLEGQAYESSETGRWDGVVIPRTTPTAFSFLNNSITSVNASGYLLQAGDESPTANSNHLDGSVITGNIFVWNGTDTSSITHGVFMGYNINNIVKYNYLERTPYGILFKSGNEVGENMTYTYGGAAYNICRNSKMCVRTKGMNGVGIYNNTFYNDINNGSGQIILLTGNQSQPVSSPSLGIKVFNNIFYTKYPMALISVESSSLVDFQSDYNLFYCETGDPVFAIDGSWRTFEEWQDLGFDTHSVVLDPGFIDLVDFVPTVRLDGGLDLGVGWADGLAIDATWGTTAPAVTPQNGSWQIGARVFAPEGCE
jgi:hypothetical protein